MYEGTLSFLFIIEHEHKFIYHPSNIFHYAQINVKIIITLKDLKRRFKHPDRVMFVKHICNHEGKQGLTMLCPRGRRLGVIRRLNAHATH